MILLHVFISILGKSLICKEKCIQVSEEESYTVEQGLKVKADAVFFISMVGLSYNQYGSMIGGIVDEYEHLFDIYSKTYDFPARNVQVLSAQDLWKFYKQKRWYKWNKRSNFNIYELVEFFIHHHPNGHFVLDECPFLRTSK